MPSFQSQMEELRRSNENVLKQNIQKIDYDLEKELLDIKQNAKWAELGSNLAKQAVQVGMAAHERHKTRKAVSSYYRDKHADKLKYIDSDKSQVNIEAITNAKEFSRNLNNSLVNMRIRGTDASVINKIKGADPIKGMLLANADLANLANRFPELIQNHFRNDDTILPGMGKSIKEIFISGTYDEKLAVHEYLKGEFITQVIQSGYDPDYLMLPKEAGGSGFFDEIDGHEVTLKEGYSSRSDIMQSESEIAFAWSTYAKTGDEDDFIAWIQAVRTGTNAKGEKYIENWDKYTKFIDENIGNAVDAGLINKPKLDIIANTIVPGTEDDKRYPLLGPDGKPNGKYGQTYAQKWPTKFGYDPDNGIIGSYYQRIAEKISKDDERIKGNRKSEFEEKKGDIIESLNSMVNPQDRVKVYASIAEEYGDLDGFGEITEAFNSSNEIEDNKENVDVIVNKQASGSMIQHVVPANTQLAKNPTVAALLEAEKKITDNDEYKKGLLVIGNKLNSGFKILGQESTIMVGDELLLYRTLENNYYNYVKNGKTFDEAKDLVIAEWIAGGGEHDISNASMKNEAKYWKDNEGVESNIYSLDGNKKLNQRKDGGVPNIEKQYGINLISRSDRLNNIKKDIKSIAKNNKISVEEALTKINSETELPLYTIEGESKELLKNALDNIDNIKSFPSMYTDIAAALNIPTSDVLNWRLKANGLGELPEKFVKECGAGIRKYCKNTIINQSNGKGPLLNPWYKNQAEVANAANEEARNNGGETPESQTVIAAGCGGESVCVATEVWCEENGITPTAADLNVVTAYFNMIEPTAGLNELQEDKEVELVNYLLNTWKMNRELFNQLIETPEMQRELYALTGKKTDYKFNFLLPLSEETNSE